MFQTKVVEKFKPHILCSITFFFLKSSLLWENVGKYFRAGQVTGDNMAHAHFTLDTWSNKHTLTICNTYCFSNATVIARTHSNVTLYVHWPLLSKTKPYEYQIPIYTSLTHNDYSWVKHGFVLSTVFLFGVPVAQLVEVLHYKSQGRGFDSRWCHRESNTSGRTMALGLTQPIKEMSTRSISWGVKAAGS